MATHSSVLAWRIPGMGEPGCCCLWGRTELDTTSLLDGPILTSIHDYWKNHSFDYTDLCWQSNVSASYMLSRLVIVFLQRSMHLLISWLQSPSTVTLEPKKIKSVTVSIVSPSICHEVMGSAAIIIIFSLNIEF